MAWVDEKSPSKTVVNCEAALRFDDDFAPESHDVFQEFQQHLPDSKVYLASLESKLARLKDQDRISPKQMLESLQKVREFYMNQLLESTCAHPASEAFENVEDQKGKLMTNVERRLFPEKTAMSAEELQKLLEADLLARNTEQLHEEHPFEMNISR